MALQYHTVIWHTYEYSVSLINPSFGTLCKDWNCKQLKGRSQSRTVLMSLDKSWLSSVNCFFMRSVSMPLCSFECSAAQCCSHSSWQTRQRSLFVRPYHHSAWWNLWILNVTVNGVFIHTENMLGIIKLIVLVLDVAINVCL